MVKAARGGGEGTITFGKRLTTKLKVPRFQSSDIKALAKAQRAPKNIDKSEAIPPHVEK